MIPFNKPYLTGDESKMIELAFKKGKFSGNGYFTKKCHSFIQERFGFDKCLLTNSATSAIEMATILCDIKEGDEVIIPSYTFVASATPFALRKAKLVFCDSEKSSPNINVDEIERLITHKTKVLLVVHYAGQACDMDRINALAEQYKLFIIEDAAHSITSKYKNQFLGSFGHLAVFSFHETKNISCGQGGMLVINDQSMIERAEVIWAKGTNRLAMEKGEVPIYEWQDLGSNFYPSEITAAFLYAQLQYLDEIQDRRKLLWEKYRDNLLHLASSDTFLLPEIKNYQENNYHIFYLVCRSNEERNDLISYLNQNEILAVFHYLPLHKSPYIKSISGGLIHLKNAEYFSDNLIRLPLFAALAIDQVDYITSHIVKFYKNR